MPNVSLICTVLNEESSIDALMASISKQTRIPNEVIIVDGGSTDGTVAKLKKAKKKFPQLRVRISTEKTNRSEGRNFAILKAKYNTIAITDAGCVLDPDWLYELVKKKMQTGADVIAGFYRSEPKTAFEEAVVPFTLVMPDKVDPLSFLPATRSMLISKNVFEKVGYFNPKYEVSEDYEFAHRLKNGAIAIVFCKEATVVWQPRKKLSSFYKMVSSMAEGDARAHVLRPKVYLVFLRYLLFGALALTSFVSAFAVFCLGMLLILYTLWAVWKNHHYVSAKAYLWLAALQYVADVGVLVGTVRGLFAAADLKEAKK